MSGRVVVALDGREAAAAGGREARALGGWKALAVGGRGISRYRAVDPVDRAEHSGAGS
ncbi:hypothetical protein AB0883_01935 [Micromonospora sp. NPDC047812]|uniref:hypothetical protein n=1 Tax=Micromonospora sp. NPDC047812 TaxID=3155742 RepID=UPI0034553C09